MAWSTGGKPSSGGSSGSSSGGAGTKVVATIDARDALTKVAEGTLAYVVDASDDPLIESGAATYIYLGGQWVLQTAPKSKTKPEDVETNDEKDFISKEEKEQIDTNKQDIKDLKDKDIFIETNVNKNKNDITTNKDNINKNKVDIDSLKTKDTQIEQKITTLGESLNNKADKVHTHEIADVNELQTVLDNKASLEHSHAITDVANLQEKLDGKSDTGHVHDITEVTDLVDTLNGLRLDLDAIDLTQLTSFEISQVNNLQSVLDTLNNLVVNKAEEQHTHDASDVTGILEEVERILQSMGFDTSSGQHTHTASEITDFVQEVKNVINAAVPATHEHEIGEVKNLQSVLDGKSEVSHTHQISDVAGLEAALQNVGGAVHKHDISEINDLQSTLDNKANKAHNHTIAQITDLQGNLDTLSNGISNLNANKAEKIHAHKWDDITSKPSSSVVDIDNAVTKVHEHTNKEVIDQLEDAGGILTYRGVSLSGEFITVETEEDRDAIPLDVRSEGMTVLVRQDNSMFFLKGGVDNAFWEIFSVGAGGATNAATLPASPSGKLTGVNAQSLFDQLESNKAEKDLTYTKVEVDDKFANQIIDYATLDNLPDLTMLHKHENLTTLDKFGELKGDLTWNGKTLGNMINDYYDSDGDGLVDRAATLEGLTSTIEELNHSAGLTGNIQSQLDALSSGTKFKGEFATFSDMLDVVGGEKGDWVFIQVDEMQGNAKNTQYYHDGNDWIYGGGATKNPEATLTQSGTIKLGGVLANPSSTASSPQLTNTGVIAGYYSSPNITVGADGRITFIEANDTIYLNDAVTSEKESWSSQKISDLFDTKADKTHSHPQLHDADLLGKIRLTDMTPNDKYAITYNAETGKAEWTRQQGGKVFVGSKFIEGDYTLKAGSYINLFIDDVTKEITINSTFRDGVNSGVPTLTEITESIVVPKGETVRFSSPAAFNKYMVNVIKMTNDKDCAMELSIFEQGEGGTYEYLSNREYRTHDILSLPISDLDQTKKIHLAVTNYGVEDCTATIKIKTTNLI